MEELNEWKFVSVEMILNYLLVHAAISTVPVISRIISNIPSFFSGIYNFVTLIVNHKFSKELGNMKAPHTLTLIYEVVDDLRNGDSISLSLLSIYQVMSKSKIATLKLVLHIDSHRWLEAIIRLKNSIPEESQIRIIIIQKMVVEEKNLITNDVLKQRFDTSLSIVFKDNRNIDDYDAQ